MLNRILLTSFLATISFCYTQAQVVQGEPITGEKGVTVSVTSLLQNARPIPHDAAIEPVEERKAKRKPTHHPNALKQSSYPTAGNSQPTLGQYNTQNIQSNFLAIDIGESQSIPPDPMGDISESQIGIASNGRIKFYDKPATCGSSLNTSITGGTTPLANPVFSMNLDDFFASVRNGTSTTDPHMHFDRTAGRWFITVINTAEPANRILLAVSSSAVISNLSSFTFYQFQHDQGTVSGGADNASFCDYPTLGVDRNALYLSGLIFKNEAYSGTSLYVVRKSSVLNGGPIVWTPFRRIGNDNSGIFCAQGVSNDDATAASGYYIGVDAGFFGQLDLVVVGNPGGTPTISQSTLTTIPDTDFPINQPASGSTKPLDGGDDRLHNVTMKLNRITGSRTIWTSHNIGVNQNGVATDGNRNAVRWYELGISGNQLQQIQTGTLFSGAAQNPTGYWMGTIAASGQGHAVVGTSSAGANIFANVVVAGRYNSTTPGNLFSPVNATNYSAAYNQQTSDDDIDQRWGDYSQTVTDPSDDMTMWTFQQFTDGTNRWGVRAVQLQAPPPATPTGISGLLCDGSGISDVTISATATNNAGFFDPGTGFPKRLSVTSTGMVDVSNIAFISPTQLSFSLDYRSATPGSPQTLTITNPDCQAVNFAYTVPQGCDQTRRFLLVPNPATSSARVFVPSSGGELRVIAADGKLMMKTNVSGSSQTIATAAFARGIYFIEYRINGEVYKERLLLQ